MSPSLPGEKIISGIITDLWDFYESPIILPPLLPDIPGHGTPSDHSVPFAKVHLDRSKPREKNYVTKSVRPLPDSGILEFGQWIQGENFECLTYCKISTEQVAALEKLIIGKIDEISPRIVINTEGAENQRNIKNCKKNLPNLRGKTQKNLLKK